MAALLVAIISAIAAAGSALFAGFSWRMLAKQTESLADQVRLQHEQTLSLTDQVRLQSEQTNELAEQTQLQTKQYKVFASSTELQFNLNVMIRLQEVLFKIAGHEKSRSEIWGDLDDGRQEVLDGDALLDVIEMALKACERLPNFASNEEDWSSYSEYVMANSRSVRERAMSLPKQWPEITPYAVAAEVAPYALAAVRVYGEAVLTKVHDEAVDATVELGRRLLQRIFRTREEHEQLHKLLVDVVADPADEDEATLQLAIRKALANDLDLQDEIRDILQEGVSVTGDRPVAAQGGT